MQGGISAALMLFLPLQWVSPCLPAGPSTNLASAQSFWERGTGRTGASRALNSIQI